MEFSRRPTHCGGVELELEVLSRMTPCGGVEKDDPCEGVQPHDSLEAMGLTTPCGGAGQEDSTPRSCEREPCG